MDGSKTPRKRKAKGDRGILHNGHAPESPSALMDTQKDVVRHGNGEQGGDSGMVQGEQNGVREGSGESVSAFQAWVQDVSKTLRHQDDHLKAIDEVLTKLANRLDEVKVLKTANPQPLRQEKAQGLGGSLIEAISAFANSPLAKKLIEGEPAEDAVINKFKAEYEQTIVEGLKNQRELGKLAVDEVKARIANLSKKSLWDQQ